MHSYYFRESKVRPYMNSSFYFISNKMQLCGAQKEDSAPFSSLPSNQTGTCRDFSHGSSKHLLYSTVQVANKGAYCAFKTITAPQPIFREQDLLFPFSFFSFFKWPRIKSEIDRHQQSYSMSTNHSQAEDDLILFSQENGTNRFHILRWRFNLCPEVGYANLQTYSISSQCQQGSPKTSTTHHFQVFWWRPFQGG